MPQITSSNEKDNLIEMLKQAAKLEHTLLDSYLFAACTLKTMPFEFDKLSNEKANLRKAIHFEKARQWKQSILNVSHEEMLHLHYVQCLLRALGEQPYFELPDRNSENGNWLISNWDLYSGEDIKKEGVEIPLCGLTTETIKRFILFESTDSLQNENPFDDKTVSLFKRLYDFEIEFHLEGLLFNISDDDKREKLKAKLKDIYINQPPSEELEPHLQHLMAEVKLGEDLTKYIRFQSIGDFYLKGILPLFEQAFLNGDVVNSNRAFNNEILGPKAAEGFLPIGPVYRSKNFTDYSNANSSNPLKYFKNIKSIVNEIVEEGEGFDKFEDKADKLLQQVEKLGGVRNYIKEWKNDKTNGRNPNYSTPKWLFDAELCRQSHLYRFALIFVDMNLEKELSQKVNVEFSAIREPVNVGLANHGLAKMIKDLPKFFNSCYLVMLAWLSRLYEIKDWQNDKDRRYAIEMIATWPLMSLAIRPFLELASFFPIDQTHLFRLNKEFLPSLPPEALQLANYFESKERNQQINNKIDFFALRILSNAASWASESLAVIEELFTGAEKEMITTRLKALSKLNEFEISFHFENMEVILIKFLIILFKNNLKMPKTLVKIHLQWIASLQIHWY